MTFHTLLTALAVNVSLDLRDILLGLLILAGIVALVVLIVLLIRVITTMKKVNKLLDDVSVPLVETTAELPAMAVKIRDILGNLVDITDDVTASSPELLEHTLDALDAANSGVGAVSALVVGLSNGLLGIVDRVGATASVGGFGSILSTIFAAFAAGRRRGKRSGKRKKRR